MCVVSLLWSQSHYDHSQSNEVEYTILNLTPKIILFSAFIRKCISPYCLNYLLKKTCIYLCIKYNFEKKKYLKAKQCIVTQHKSYHIELHQAELTNFYRIRLVLKKKIVV